jgi:hypothetical protein
LLDAEVRGCVVVSVGSMVTCQPHRDLSATEKKGKERARIRAQHVSPIPCHWLRWRRDRCDLKVPSRKRKAFIRRPAVCGSLGTTIDEVEYEQCRMGSTKHLST